MKIKTALVLGGGGFIGNAMVTRLKKENYWVRSVDLKSPEFSTSEADEFVVGDLRSVSLTESVIQLGSSKENLDTFDEIYGEFTEYLMCPKFLQGYKYER